MDELTKVRPTAGVEFVRSRQFPDDAQGNFLINNVIGFHGIKQYNVAEDGSGFAATESRAAAAVEPTRTSAPSRCASGPTARCTSSTGSIRSSATCSTRCATCAATRRTAASGASRRRTGRSLVPPRIDGEPIEAQLELLKVYEDRDALSRATRAARAAEGRGDPRRSRQWVAALDVADPDYQHQPASKRSGSIQHHDVVESAAAERVCSRPTTSAPAPPAVRVLQLLVRSRGRRDGHPEAHGRRPGAARPAGSGRRAQLHPDGRGGGRPR